MRDLRFRAWYRQSGMMGTYDLMSIDRGDSDWEWEQDQDVYFMQYTGLKDKNGKEIYEGDILEFITDVGNKWIYPPIQHSKGCYNFGEGKKSVWNMVSRIDLKFEVIGNIYENPNLLENE